MDSEYEKTYVTLMVLGETGVGKSENGYGFLQKKNAFEANSQPNACTYRTCVQSNLIDGITRYYIDTQGLSSPDDKDAEYIQQMISFLQNWKKGVNAFFIILNIQNPRFDSGIQQLIRLANAFFNNPYFWNQTGIIFTKCYPGFFDREMAETQYRERVVDFIKSLPHCDQIDPQMPCFFVNSVEWENDQSTKDEYDRIFEYAYGNYPVSTENMIPVSPDFQDVCEEYNENVLVNTEYQGEGADRIKINTYETQMRYKYTLWDGSIKYSDVVTVESWIDEINSSILEESKIEEESNRTEIFRIEEGTQDLAEGIINSIFGLGGPKVKYEHDHYETVTKFTKLKRNAIIDPDGNVTYTDWIPTATWNEIKLES